MHASEANETPPRQAPSDEGKYVYCIIRSADQRGFGTIGIGGEKSVYTVRAFPIGDGKRVRIEVRDSGIGIRQEDMDAIFDDFRQVDQSSTRKYGGTGLGLSITRKLVRLMGGTVEVESEFGKGSVFRVDLPVTVDATLLPGIGVLNSPLHDDERS